MPVQRPEAGRLNAAIANGIGKLIADFTGRGASRSRAFMHDDLVVRLLEDGRRGSRSTSSRQQELVRLQATRCNARWNPSSSRR
jgi:hypothetical protein